MAIRARKHMPHHLLTICIQELRRCHGPVWHHAYKSGCGEILYVLRCIRTHTHTYIYIYIYIYTYVYVYIYIFICIYTYRSISSSLSLSLYLYIYIYTLSCRYIGRPMYRAIGTSRVGLAINGCISSYQSICAYTRLSGCPN